MRRRRPDSLDPKIHHNNLLTSILAKIEANVAGADDALMLDDVGFVAETNATHVFFVDGRRRAHADDPRLPRGHHPRDGARALRRSTASRVEVGDLSLTHVYNADEVFVTGTMGGLTPVLAVDGRLIGTGKPGPVTETLSAAYAELTAQSGTPV